jgi:hypothetical protein
MRRRGRAVWVTGILLAGISAALPGVEVAYGELSFELPPGWRPSARAGGLAAPGVVLLAWERELDGRLYTLALEAVKATSRLAASRIGREMPRIARTSVGSGNLEVREMQFPDAKGPPAYRIRGRTAIDGVSVEQLQHVIAAREKTFLLTFAWGADLPPAIEDEMRGTVASIRLEPEPALMEGVSAGALCALLGILVGMGSLRTGARCRIPAAANRRDRCSSTRSRMT